MRDRVDLQRRSRRGGQKTQGNRLTPLTLSSAIGEMLAIKFINVAKTAKMRDVFAYYKPVAEASTSRWQFLVCEGPTCGGCKFSATVTAKLRSEVDAQKVADRCGVQEYLCLGRCRDGVNVVVRRMSPDDELDALPSMNALEEDDVWLYSQVDPEVIPAVLRSHVEEDCALKPLAEEY